MVSSRGGSVHHSRAASTAAGKPRRASQHQHLLQRVAHVDLKTWPVQQLLIAACKRCHGEEQAGANSSCVDTLAKTIRFWQLWLFPTGVPGCVHQPCKVLLRPHRLRQRSQLHSKHHSPSATSEPCTVLITQEARTAAFRRSTPTT